MGYFKYLPDIKYDTKPISYPFSESDFVVAKNFFRRFKVNDDFYSYAVFFRQYQVGDFEKPWQVADLAYSDPELDWMILLTNNIVNPLFDWPMDSYTFRKYLEGKYADPYGTIKHYETYEHKDTAGVVVQKAGLIVDESFYYGSHKFYDSRLGTAVTLSGVTLAKPVTIFEWEEQQNEKSREIYLLKPEYVEGFKDNFRKANKYKDSTDFISTRLKKTGV
jgi:hypothetical protein